VVHRLTGLIAVHPLVERERNIGLAPGRADLLREGLGRNNGRQLLYRPASPGNGLRKQVDRAANCLQVGASRARSEDVPGVSIGGQHRRIIDFG
jgi:hypothetical protein